MTLWTRQDDFCIDIWVSNRETVYLQQCTSAKLDWAQDQLGHTWDDATPWTGRRDPYFLFSRKSSLEGDEMREFIRGKMSKCKFIGAKLFS